MIRQTASVWSVKDSDLKEMVLNGGLVRTNGLKAVLERMFGCTLPNVLALVSAFDSGPMDAEWSALRQLYRYVEKNQQTCTALQNLSTQLASHVKTVQSDFWRRWFTLDLCESGRKALERYQCTVEISTIQKPCTSICIKLCTVDGDTASITDRLHHHTIKGTDTFDHIIDFDICVAKVAARTDTNPWALAGEGFTLQTIGSWNENFEPNHPTNPDWNDQGFRYGGILTGWNGVKYTTNLDEMVSMIWNQIPHELLYTRYTLRPISERDEIAKRRAQKPPPTHVFTEAEWVDARDNQSVFEPLLLIIHAALILPRTQRLLSQPLQ